MRVEKISDTQMRFVLMTEDLEDRDMSVKELSYASEKTQRLFREIMELVQDEDDFTGENSPLMFEAMQVGVDSLIVLVTKISNWISNDKNIELIPHAISNSTYRKNGIDAVEESEDEDSYSVFSFDDIDILAAAADRLCYHFDGVSQVYKMDNRLYLLIKNETEDLTTTAELEQVLYEFGQKHVSNAISHHYLMERGELFIAADAVDKLRVYHSVS